MKKNLYTDHQALEPLNKRNRCNKQYSTRLTQCIDRLTPFDISIQHIAGSNLQFTEYFSSNPVEGARPEENYDEEYVITILIEQAELTLKEKPIFADQSKLTNDKEEIRNNNTETQIEHRKNEPQTNKIFLILFNVNKTEQKETTATGQTDNNTSHSGRKN